MFSYITFRSCHRTCILGLTDNVFSLEDFSYLTYFGLSISAYILFILAYKPENFKFSSFFIIGFLIYLALIALSLPTEREGRVWYTYHEYFHLTAMIMIIFITFRNILNYAEKKNLNSFLVMVSFGLISLFHLFHLFSFVSGWMYVFAHISILIGFSSLLFMVLRVKK